jgi:polyphosphate:AMP phosphotransferase
VERAFRRSSREELESELAEIAALERLLAADGTVLVKLWFHLGEQEQERRLERLARDGERALTPWEKRFRSRYRRFAKVSARALDATDAPHAPWHVIDAGDRRRRDLAAGKILLAALERAVQPQEREPRMETLVARSATPARSPILAAVDLSSTLEEAEYRERLRAARAELDRLTWKARENRRSTVVVFEGWDAAGKGGAIRRVSASIDARLCRVIPIAAPTDEERAQHYLWRFWRHVPRAGYVTIFDRSWYGRVLVERVEGPATEAEWTRAYDELVHFERELARGGVIVQKLWLHVSAAEQLRRFEERASSAVKQYKIGPEDWRNRARWADYELALHDIFTHTAIPEAPWEIVAANDKRWARVQVLETLVRRLNEAL